MVDGRVLPVQNLRMPVPAALANAWNCAPRDHGH
jgi:hypothetical protein